MNNQEMQFADPDWKPSQQLDTKTGPEEREGYNPQPINTGYREQNQWRTTTSAPQQEEGYTGLRPYTGPAPQQMQGGNFRQRQYSRRGRGPWFWIILAFIIISLASGGFRSFNGPNFNGPNFDRSSYAERSLVGKPITYTVIGQPNIVINDPNGSVQVNVDPSNNVTLQAVGGNNFFGNPNDIQQDFSRQGNTITASVPDSQSGSFDLQVTVPPGSDLNITTNSGDISVTGVDGKMTLTTTSGNITASNDVMSGSSILTTDSGGINFDGDVSKGGTYQLKTNRGDVDLLVSNNSAFHIEASTNSGSIDIPGVTPSSSGTKASGDVGTSSQIQGTGVNITTDSGNITVNQR